MNTSTKKAAALLAAVMTMTAVSGCGSRDEGVSANTPANSAEQTSPAIEDSSADTTETATTTTAATTTAAETDAPEESQPEEAADDSSQEEASGEGFEVTDHLLRYYDNASVYFKKGSEYSFFVNNADASVKELTGIPELEGIPMLVIECKDKYNDHDYCSTWEISFRKLFKGAEDRIADVNEIHFDIIGINRDTNSLIDYWNIQYSVSVVSDLYAFCNVNGNEYTFDTGLKGLGEVYGSLAEDSQLHFYHDDRYDSYNEEDPNDTSNYGNKDFYIADIQFLDKDGNVIVCPEFTR